MAEGFQRTHDAYLWLHKKATTVTASEDGSVAGVAMELDTGPGIFADGTELIINVVSIDATTGDEAYQLEWKGQVDGGGYTTLAIFPIPTTSAGQAFRFPISNRGWDGVPCDELKVRLTLAGTTPIINCTVRLATPGL